MSVVIVRLAPCVRGNEPIADSRVYYLPFDGAAQAATYIGGQPGPLVERGVTFVPGIRGQAVYVGGNGNYDYAHAPSLAYDAGGLLTVPAGTVSFWVRPNWDGFFDDPNIFPWYFLLNVVGGKNPPDFDTTELPPDHPYGRFSLFMWNWLRGDVDQKVGESRVFLESRCRPSWMKDDWWHIAFTWNGTNDVCLYVDGLPRPGVAEHKLADSQWMFIGCGPRTWMQTSRANAAFDEFKIYNRALTGPDIREEFRGLAPVDFSVERRYLRADTPEQVVVELEPGAGAVTPVVGELRLRFINDANGQTVAERRVTLQLAGRESFTLDVPAVTNGNYRLECVLVSGAARYQRSYALSVYAQQPAPVVSPDPVARGERIVSIDCTIGGQGFYESGASRIREVPGVGRYREIGSNKMNRCAFEIEIPQADGSPVMLEVSWPDDVERSMGFYMMPRADSDQHRDRLGGGIQSGGEYPLSGAMQKACYLFYPGESRYLFEARTMVTGLPAAVSKVEIFRLAERLSKLPIAAPTNLPGRLLGHLDEDQSFEIWIAPRADRFFPKSPLRNGYPIQVLERLMDYFDYTGQNVLSYSLARYDWTHYDEGPINSPGSALLPPGGVRLMLDMLHQRGQYLIGNLNLYGTPEKPAAIGLGLPASESLEQRIQDGYFLFDRYGNPQMPPPWGGSGGMGTNPLHPVNRARLLEIIDELLRRYGQHPAFKGIDIWCGRARSPFILSSLEYGYDDRTLLQFTQETGITVPGDDPSPARFDHRYRYLTGEKRAAWVAWRAAKTTQLFTEINNRVRATRPDLTLFLSPADGWWRFQSESDLSQSNCEGFDFPTEAREQFSMDLDALVQLPGVVVNPQLFPTAYRWVKAWYGKESVFREFNSNVAKLQAFRNGPRGALSLYMNYFESFNGSLKQDEFKSLFQNADIKGHGRFFLEDFARGMAGIDPAVLLAGSQPLGSAGRDIEIREFAQAFRALPAGAYEDVDGLEDPVAVRLLQTSDATYLYAANLIWTPVSVTLQLEDPAASITDLSGGQTVAVTAGKATIELKPFELRVLRIEGNTAVTGSVVVAQATSLWYQEKFDALEDDLQEIVENGYPAAPQHERLEAIRNALGRGAYAEAHRLLFSKMMRELGELKQYCAAGFFIACALTQGWGDFSDFGTWVGGFAPGATDNTWFGVGLPVTYGLTFNGTPSCANAFVNNGSSGLGLIVGPSAGNGWLITNSLVIAPTPGSAGSVFMDVGRETGGILIVTNAAGTASVVVGQAGYGKLWLYSGNAIFDKLLATNGANSLLSLRDCNLTTLHGATINANGGAFSIGDGGTGEVATWNMMGGTHTIGNGQTYLGKNDDDWGRGMAIVSGVGTIFTNASLVWIGLYHGGSGLVVSNGASALNSSVIEMGVYGVNIRGRNSDNQIMVTGSGSLLQSADYIRVGGGGDNNGLTVADGGTVTVGSRATWMGGDLVGGTNRILVTGAGSLFQSLAGVRVGVMNKGNTLTVADGGEARLGSSVIGEQATAKENRMVVSGGILNIIGNAVSLDVRHGALVLNSGRANLASLLVTNGANGALTFNGGTLSVSSTTVSNGSVCVVGDGVSDATLALLDGTHVFANGVTVSANAVLAAGGSHAIGTATVKGNVTLQEGAVVDCDFNATGHDWLVVQGNLTLPPRVTLRLRALDSSMRYPIPVLQATTITGDAAGWPTVLANGMTYQALVVGNQLVLRQAPAGTNLIVR